MIPRHLTPSLLAALADTPIVFLRGPRQTGKTTLTSRALAPGDDGQCALAALMKL